MKRRKISVVINNYNYGSFLDRALESALAQDGEEAEVIVVDDGSRDHSRSVLERYRGKARVILQENRGQASAINVGVNASSGEFISFLDADDWWAPGKLASVLQAFESDPRAVLVYHRLQPIHSDGSRKVKPIPRSLCSGDLTRRLSKSAGWWPFPMTSAVSVRRSAWDEIGEIPASFRICADAWLVGIYPFVGQVAALPATLGFYRIHNNNWYREGDDEAMLQKRMQHWESAVLETNRFLASHGTCSLICLDDHFPYQIAAARLSGANARERARLAIRGVSFAGEPNLLRRTRDTFKAIRGIPSVRSLVAKAGGSR